MLPFLGTGETEESKYRTNGSSWSTTADLISHHNRPRGTDHNEDNGDLPVHYTPDKSSGIHFAHWQRQILRKTFLQTDGYIDKKTLTNLETQLGAHRSHINVSAELFTSTALAFHSKLIPRGRGNMPNNKNYLHDPCLGI